MEMFYMGYVALALGGLLWFIAYLASPFGWLGAILMIFSFIRILKGPAIRPECDRLNIQRLARGGTIKTFCRRG